MGRKAPALVCDVRSSRQQRHQAQHVPTPHSPSTVHLSFPQPLKTGAPSRAENGCLSRAPLFRSGPTTSLAAARAMVAAWLGAWVLSYVAGRICDNTCANHVNNSVCGDWTGSCPFGSDCGDCGVREYSIGTSEDLGTPAFVVCKATPDHRILESARFLAGAAAYPHSGLVQTPACVQFNCFDLEAPGCAGSCAELASHGPLCVPMARTDKAMSYSLDEYKISFARTKFDNNIS